MEVAHTAHTAGVAAARQGHTGNNSPRIAWVAQHLVQDSGGKMLPMRTNDYLEDLRICTYYVMKRSHQRPSTGILPVATGLCKVTMQGQTKEQGPAKLT